MRYHCIREGIFQSRPNRFIALVELDGAVERCHVKNTGRCRELLVPGARVFLECSGNPERKTAYDLVAVDKGGLLINMDSQAPNRVVREYLESGMLFPSPRRIRPEFCFGQSRFDFYVEDGAGKGHFLEVKGVTLEEDGLARFPDAPTERGLRHIRELCRCADEGFGAWILFVVQMEGMRELRPNWSMQPAFGEALLEARRRGVRILAMDCSVTPEELRLRAPVPIRLEKK